MPNPQLKVRFLLFDGFSNLVLACLMEPLRVARDQTGGPIDWQVLTPGGGAVVSSSGLVLTPTLPAPAPRDRCDLLVVVSGYGFRDHASAASARLIWTLAQGAGRVIAADTAGWLLAHAGLVTGTPVALHWQVAEDFAEAFPDTPVAPGGIVRSGRIWSCSSASTALGLIQDFIAERFGPALAYDTSAMFVQDAAPESDAPGQAAPLRGSASPRLRQTLRRMAATIAEPLSLEALAREAGVSLRSLNRLFLDEMGLPPGRYYLTLRLARARDLLLNTRMRQSDIALRCGFSGAPALARAYRQEFAQTPGEVRQRAAHRDNG